MNPGDQVGDYRIVDAIGAGGSGRVYRVRHEITGRIEAMKALLPDQSEEDELCDRFLREVRIHARLVHPNIASLVTAFWADRRLIMVMEYVEGESLDRILQRERLPLRRALRYASQALSGLSYAHAHGVTHRDVKPENLLLGPNDVLKLTDFGLAKTARDIRLTQTGALMGSLYYVSPEQLRGLHTADERSDIYSMGAVLYELVTGRRPFVGAEAFELMLAHDKLQPTAPAKVAAGVPPALSKAIMKALQKDPEDRFASADEFRQAVDAVLASLPEEDGSRAGDGRNAAATTAVRLASAWKALAARAPAAQAVAVAAVFGLSVVGASFWLLFTVRGGPGAEGAGQTASGIPGAPAALAAAEGLETAIRALTAPPRLPSWPPPQNDTPAPEPTPAPVHEAAASAQPPPKVVEVAKPPLKEPAPAAPPPAVAPEVKVAIQTAGAPPAADAKAVQASVAPAFPGDIPAALDLSELPEKIQIRLLTPLASDDASRSRVAARVTRPAELAGARVEGFVVDSKSSQSANGESSLEIEFVTLHHGGRTISIESHVVELRNSQGASGVDDNGHRLKRNNGVFDKGKKAAVRIGSAIGGFFGRGKTDDRASSPSTVLSAGAPRIALLPGSEFDLDIAAWAQVSHVGVR